MFGSHLGVGLNLDMDLNRDRCTTTVFSMIFMPVLFIDSWSFILFSHAQLGHIDVHMHFLLMATSGNVEHQSIERLCSTLFGLQMKA